MTGLDSFAPTRLFTPGANRVLPFFRRWLLRDVRQAHPTGVDGPKPPDGPIIAQGEEPARGGADLDDPSHATTITSGYFPSALRTSLDITPTSEPSPS
jgi:hypothetical protein